LEKSAACYPIDLLADGAVGPPRASDSLRNAVHTDVSGIPNIKVHIQLVNNVSEVRLHTLNSSDRYDQIA